MNFTPMSGAEITDLWIDVELLTSNNEYDRARRLVDGNRKRISYLLAKDMRSFISSCEREYEDRNGIEG